MPTMNPEEARNRVASARVARLATVSGDGQPHLAVFTFAVDQGWIHHAVDHKPKSTTDLRRIRDIRQNPRVSVLVDHYDDAEWERLWWVRADGRARILDTDTDRAGPIRLLIEKYRQYRIRPPAGPVIAIEVTNWSGWTYSGVERRPRSRDD